MKFYKIQSLGNDFVFFDMNHINSVDIKKICSRNFGIGADGVIFYRFIDNSVMDIILYNSDGSFARSGGNGLSCSALLAHLKGGFSEGLIKCDNTEYNYFLDNNSICVDMKTPELVDIVDDHFTIMYKNNHKVYIKQEFIKDELIEIGQNNPDFNIEFIFKKNFGYRVKVYERGSGITTGCGTGACAIFGALNQTGDLDSLKLAFDGGDITLKKDENGNIILISNPEIVFEGEIK